MAERCSFFAKLAKQLLTWCKNLYRKGACSESKYDVMGALIKVCSVIMNHKEIDTDNGLVHLQRKTASFPFVVWVHVCWEWHDVWWKYISPGGTWTQKAGPAAAVQLVQQVLYQFFPEKMADDIIIRLVYWGRQRFVGTSFPRRVHTISKRSSRTMYQWFPLVSTSHVKKFLKYHSATSSSEFLRNGQLNANNGTVVPDTRTDYIKNYNFNHASHEKLILACRTVCF